ncbi:hypothetical protein BGZ81_008650, partial [Podila clonocystis]
MSVTSQKIGSNSDSTPTLLNLVWDEIGDNGAQALSEVLKTNSNPITLNLHYNSIWIKGLLAFCE